MAQIANKNKIILFTPIATSDKLQKAGDYIFRNSPKNEKQAKKAFDFLVKERHKSNIGVVYKNSIYSTNLAKVFKDIAHNKVKICDINYNKTTDFRIVIQKLKECQVDSVFIPNNYEDTARFLKQLKENGLNLDVVSTDGSYSEKLIDIAKGSTDNFYLTMMGVDRNNKFYQQFVRKYKNKYNNEEPNIFVAYGYEAISILSKAIDLSSTKSSSEVRNILLSKKFNSLTGVLSFDKTGELNRSYCIMKIDQGKFVELQDN
jgi:ABC-type branched-subunit amino acid transport system substrate-binding protein